jgi:hypothetical protein
MDLASIQDRIPASLNVSDLHRISLSTHWQIQIQSKSVLIAQYAGLEMPGLVEQNYLVASRTFHKPSGLSNIHIVRFCFSPSLDALAYVEGAGALPLCMANSLASANITDMMKSTNRVIILWPSPFEPFPVLPEHFSAWLEIENVPPANS